MFYIEFDIKVAASVNTNYTAQASFASSKTKSALIRCSSMLSLCLFLDILKCMWWQDLDIKAGTFSIATGDNERLKKLVELFSPFSCFHCSFFSLLPAPITHTPPDATHLCQLNLSACKFQIINGHFMTSINNVDVMVFMSLSPRLYCDLPAHIAHTPLARPSFT